MNELAKRIVLGLLAVSIPVGGAVYYFSTQNSSDSEKKNEEIVDKKEEDKTDKGEEKKNDNEKHPGTDAIDESVHRDNILKLRSEYNNSEIVGVVSIPNVINTVVVQHGDNEYYLNHGLDKQENIEGSVYLDYRTSINSGRKNIIYGHNGNAETLNVPFSGLESYYEKAFYDENQYVYLEDDKGIATYQIFSVFVETRDDNYLYLNFKSDTSWLEHITYLKNKSMYDTNVAVDATDDVLILQTCSHSEEYAKYKDKYVVVVAKRVKYEN